jgi:hypothetical protein
MHTPDPRYPVGPFESVGRGLTVEERDRFIGAIEAHPAKMRAAVAGLTDVQLDTPIGRGDGRYVRSYTTWSTRT